jgi:6-phosphogluconolactonase (cycloisomerase 2 family)
MQGRVFQGGLCLLPLVAVVTSCASYTPRTGDVVADVYVETSQNAWEADPSIAPSILAFQAGPDGNLKPVPSLINASESLITGRRGIVFTADYSSNAIHQYAITQDGALSGPVSTLYPSKYDTTGCGMPSGRGMLDPTGTYLTLELEVYAQGCDVWQTYRLNDDGTYQFLGQDNSNQWVWRDGEVYMGSPGFSTTSTDGQYAYAVGEIEGWSFLAAMQRDASGVLRIWDQFDWPYDTQYRYQPRGLVTDANNHVAMLMVGQTNANWNQTWVASFSIDPSTGNLQAISTYDNMPKTATEAYGVAFSPQGHLVAAGYDGSLQTFVFHNEGPATPSAINRLPAGQYIQQMAWDTSHHLYVLTQTSLKPPAIAQFSLYVFTAADGQLKAAPGSPWNVPNASVLLVVPRG